MSGIDRRLETRYPNYGYINPVAAPIGTACRLAGTISELNLEVATTLENGPPTSATGDQLKQEDTRIGIATLVSLQAAEALESSAQRLRKAAEKFNRQRINPVAKLDGDSVEVFKEVVGEDTAAHLAFFLELHHYMEEVCDPLVRQLRS